MHNALRENNVDCYFHSNVPSVAPCPDCNKPICATCRDNTGTCPSCRLAAKIDVAAAKRQAVAGDVPPRSQQWWNAQQQTAQQAQSQPTVRASVGAPDDSQESRILVALGYPLWPLALLSLFDRKQSKRFRKHAYQALGFNFGIYAVWAVLEMISHLPLISWTPLGWSSDIVLALMIPLFIVMSVVYGIKVWHGDEVRVPIVSDWLDDRIPA
ncbi:MAG: DUF4870 domain-containing protein [Candidatus Baltobacteraceae bacterium]